MASEITLFLIVSLRFGVYDLMSFGDEESFV